MSSRRGLQVAPFLLPNHVAADAFVRPDEAVGTGIGDGDEYTKK